MYKKIYFFFFLCLCINNIQSYAVVVNRIDQEPADEEALVFANRSIIKCGPSPNETVFTSFDVRILLALSNSILDTEVPLNTDWIALSEPPIISDKNLNDIAPDIIRVVFLCLNWEDLKTANLFPISTQERKEVLAKMKAEAPWKIYSEDVQQKLSHFPDGYLNDLILIILKAKYSQPVRGDLMTNPALKSIKFAWLF